MPAPREDEMWVVALLATGCKKEEEPPPPPPAEVGFLSTWGAHNDDAAGTVAILDDGGVLAGLTLPNPARTRVLLTRLDPSGAEVWQTAWDREFDEELHASLISGGVGRVAGALWEQDVATADLRAFLLDVDLQTGEIQGNPAWEWNAAGARDAVHGLLPVGADTVAVGWGSGDVLLARIGADGAALDEVLWDGGLREEAEHAALAGDLVVLTGRVVDDANEDDFGDLYVAAFDATDLSEAWTLTWGEAFEAEEVGWSVASDGTTIVVTGGTATGDAVVLGIDLDGALLWEQTWDSGGDDVGRSVAIEPDGTALVAIDAGTDVALVRLDPATGSIVEEVTWGGTETERVRELAVSGELACLAGTVTGGPDGQDQALVTCFERATLDLPAAP